jgi:hypothetical protein
MLSAFVMGNGVRVAYISLWKSCVEYFGVGDLLRDGGRSQGGKKHVCVYLVV